MGKIITEEIVDDAGDPVGGGDPHFIGEGTPSVPPSAIGTDSLAMGDGASSLGNNNVAIGTAASASGLSGIAIGNGSDATTNYSVAIGNFAYAGYSANSIVIGSGAKSYAGNSIVMGYISRVIHISSQQCIAIGRQAKVGNSSYAASKSISIGYKAYCNTIVTSSKDSMIAIGNLASAQNNDCIAIGQNATATSYRDISIGVNSDATGGGSMALGAYSQATGNEAIAIGYEALSVTTSSIAIGNGAETRHASSSGGIVIGDGSNVGHANYYAHSCIAIGVGANVYSQTVDIVKGIAIGRNTDARASYAVSIGYGAYTRIERTANISAVDIARKSESLPTSIQAFNKNVTREVILMTQELICITTDQVIVDTAVVFTNSSTTATITSAHTLSVDEAIVFDTDGVMPANVTAQQIYYVKTSTTPTFTISDTKGGTAITFDTSGQSGNHDAYTLKIAEVEIPAGCTFYLSEVGVILSSFSTLTSQPDLRWHASNNTTDLVGITTMTGLDAVQKKECFDISTSSRAKLGVAGGEFLQMEVNAKAVATTFSCRAYFKGLLVENQ